MAQLVLVGTPLDDDGNLSSKALQAIESSEIVIGESRKQSLRWLRKSEVSEKSVFFLDPFQKKERDELWKKLTALKSTDGSAVLFSDGGMPVLFDPGEDVLQYCKDLGFEIRSTEGATSWGMALALSGFPPPFWIEGFLPKEKDKRLMRLKELQLFQSVLMDAPYRFSQLLEEVESVLGKRREVFLAWDLTRPTEMLKWGPISELKESCRKAGFIKGEFILIVRGRP